MYRVHRTLSGHGPGHTSMAEVLSYLAGGVTYFLNFCVNPTIYMMSHGSDLKERLTVFFARSTRNQLEVKPVACKIWPTMKTSSLHSNP